MVNSQPYTCIHLHAYTYTQACTYAHLCVQTYAHIELSLYITINSVTVWFYDISTIVGNLMPNPLNTYKDH